MEGGCCPGCGSGFGAKPLLREERRTNEARRIHVQNTRICINGSVLLMDSPEGGSSCIMTGGLWPTVPNFRTRKGLWLGRQGPSLDFTSERGGVLIMGMGYGLQLDLGFGGFAPWLYGNPWEIPLAKRCHTNIFKEMLSQENTKENTTAFLCLIFLLLFSPVLETFSFWQFQFWQHLCVP